MKNFYELRDDYYLDIKAYLDEWEKKLNVRSKDGKFDKHNLQSLGSFSKNLWENFNINRNEKDKILSDKHYMDSANGIRAYCASFLLPNIERVFALLVKNENSIALKNIFLNEKEELVIADFGAGPLSATVGFICALKFLFDTNPEIFPPKKIKIFAIERSEKIFQFGFDLLQKSLLNADNIVVTRLTSTEKIPVNIDIALCANIFNEIPEKHRLSNLVNLYSKLNLNGAVLIIEPGQEIHAKSLGNLRNSFLAGAEDCQIISPCSHKNLCPLSGTSTRKDWCWFKIGWNPPEALKEIEKFSKIDHHFLNFSYLFFVKSQIKVNEPFYARIVSDKLNVDFAKKSALDYFMHNIVQGDKEDFIYAAEHKKLFKMLLCTEDGSLKSTLFSEDGETELNRGMRFARKTALEFLFDERN
ncbi:MAG: small ribosomal subunit Rsm22 family protein [Bdellovibrionota bacterium]